MSSRLGPVHNRLPSKYVVASTSLDAQVLSWAVLSRLAVLAACVVSDVVLPDHQPDPSVARPTNPPWLLRAFTRWDASHFLNLATYGYRQEKDLAFFPLLPLVMHCLARLLQGIFTWDVSVVVAGLLITNACFVLSAWLLFRLSLLVLKEHALALNAVWIFCITPANVFFSSVYTESPFAACTLGGLLLLQLDRFYASAVIFGLGASLRSNGILNAGFLAHYVLLACLKQPKAELVRTCFHGILRLSVGLALALTPFVTFQAYTVWRVCFDQSEECDASDGAAAVAPEICQQVIPNAYSYIQAKYWQVGLFRYWQIKQIPNFLLALPALVLTVAGVIRILYDFWDELRRRIANSQGKPVIFRAGYTALTRCPLVPHALHWGFLAAYVFFCANVQVATRLLTSGCPIFHWFLASLLNSRRNPLKPWLKLYLGLYNVLGVIMHPNFLPWT
ncbi:unnamed protein product [Effrenium voratum]|nr:unnamed protein product [Effrenium voratum]